MCPAGICYTRGAAGAVAKLRVDVSA
jgi:hypothetical protein